MSIFRNYLINILICFFLILVFDFFLSIFNYFDIFNDNFYRFFSVILNCFSIFIGAFLLGKNSLKNGYLEGIKFGVIIIFTFIILSLILNSSFSFESVIYYFILIICCFCGGVFGINKKKEIDKN